MKGNSPPYIELPRISEYSSSRKLVTSTPRLSLWTVGFRHNRVCIIRTLSNVLILQFDDFSVYDSSDQVSTGEFTCIISERVPVLKV